MYCGLPQEATCPLPRSCHGSSTTNSGTRSPTSSGYGSEFRDLFETHFGRFEARLAQQTAELRAEFGGKLAELRAELSSREARLIRWMFAFWTTTMVTQAGLFLAVLRLK